jgi:hypothetical protein
MMRSDPKTRLRSIWSSAALCMFAGCNSPPSALHGGADAASVAAADGGGRDCADAGTGLPSDVFCTGLYAGTDPSKYAAGVMPYTPGVTLWSDGAQKQRYLYLPESSQIDNSDSDAWIFPVGTKAWKEFRFDGLLVETRLFWKLSESNWTSGTYIWNATNDSATLDTSRQGVLLDSGYEIPTAKDCGKCHHGGSDSLLGVEAVALALPTAQGVTLASLSADGRLTHPPATSAIALPEDATGKAGAALGYLHANCGIPCHSTRGLGEETKLVLRLRAGEFWPSATPVVLTDLFRATVGQVSTTASVMQEFPGAQRITPGTHEQSLVWLLAHRRGDYQMPPLVSHQIDPDGTQKIADWIDALPH